MGSRVGFKPKTLRKSATSVVSGITAQVRRVITRSEGLGTGYYWVQVLGDHTKLMGDHREGVKDDHTVTG